jgi:clan AA aspartic protease (TIGR02281 family)
MVRLLCALLLLSVMVNVYLFSKVTSTTASTTAEPTFDSPSISASETPASTPVASDRPSDVSVAHPSERSSPEVPESGVTLAFLNALKQAKEYDRLRFYVQEYLRSHPQDIEALLLEAEVYYYTAPLNMALVNYYGLLDENLDKSHIENILKLIDVNTTRIIQQFSGDGSWDLLAEFLEPLIQVDPLNRRYVMALATAYGKQNQTVLMENVLAALPSDDLRAQRLRESIYAQDSAQVSPESAWEELADNQDRNDTTETGNHRLVPLIERNGQYYTDVKINSVNARLLIDTGASTTAVTDSVFAKVDPRKTTYLGNFNVQTAGGSISSALYKVSEIQVGSEIFNNISVMVLPTENMRDFDGLLGVNVIRRFNLTYDPSVGTMRMYRKARR